MPKVYITFSSEPPTPVADAHWWLSGVVELDRPELVRMAANRLADMWNESPDVERD